jgi:hypothetical protein
LEYYPIYAQETIETNIPLSCNILKFYVDPNTEYVDMYQNNLYWRENEIIQIINRPDSSIYDLTAFNLLHNKFSLELF